MRRPATALLAPALLACLVTAGCGNQRSEGLSLAAEPSEETVEHRYPEVGLAFELPRNVIVRATEPPGVFRGDFGGAVVSGFAYRREERLPGDDVELRTAKRRLERAAEERDRSFELRDSRTTEVSGSRAVELLGDQTISSGKLRIRSLHVYEGRAEYVLELLAPSEEFARLDPALFAVLRRSLVVTGRVKRRPG
ncbi:hypothetical protein BH20ACT19_BH20ACT19_05670 [soil metagenome]